MRSRYVESYFLNFWLCAHQWRSAWRKYVMTVFSRVRGYLTTVVFSSDLGRTVWSSRQPKPRWAVSTSPPKKTAVAPTATSTPTRTAPRRCRSTGETGSQMGLLKISICMFVYVGYVCAVFSLIVLVCYFKVPTLTSTLRVRTFSLNTTWARRSMRRNM